MEAALIDWLRKQIPADPRLATPIGDDAAVLDFPPNHQTVISTDMLMDGVDFVVGEVDSARIGHKALAVNLSDLAAMAATPVAAVISLALPRSGGRKIAEGIYRGLLPLAETFEVAIAGGDTNSWDGPLVINVAVLGAVESGNARTRSGAMPGDRILVTGRFGGTILGRHLEVRPRVRESIILASAYEIHAGIDVSDGLACDLNHLCVESGCGAIVNIERVPIHEDAMMLSQQRADGVTPLDHALSDGEDFELILAVPPREAKRLSENCPIEIELTDIGGFTSEPGLRSQSGADGLIRPLTVTGFQHAFE